MRIAATFVLVSRTVFSGGSQIERTSLPVHFITNAAI